jgi:Kef-type K+ transport system membrane component KefB
MIPRGEVGLIFAQIGLSTRLLDSGLYTSVALMVIGTTFIAPLLLRQMLPPAASTTDEEGSLVMDAPMDRKR